MTFEQVAEYSGILPDLAGFETSRDSIELIAQKAAGDGNGRPTFPILHQKDDADEPVPIPRGAIPCFHSFRHTAASWAIAEGEGAEEVSWQLGHKDSTVTRKVYVQEVKSAERSARRREQMEQRYSRIVVAE